MSRLRLHPEHHLVDRIGWLRAAVLGANDGIVSTASLIVGVAAAAATQNAVLDRRRRGTGGRRHVDGRRRICIGQFAIRHRTGGSRARTQGAERKRRVRTRRACRNLRQARSSNRRLRGRLPSS